jgi:hypothetical protein
MERTSYVAKEALEMLVEALGNGNDSMYDETIASFKDSIQKLENVIHFCEQDIARIIHLWRAKEKRTSDCVCPVCDLDEREIHLDSIRQALIENAAEPRPILPTLKISEIPQTE